MIRKSFIFLKGISNRREKNLWNSGIKDWNDFINNKKIVGISEYSKFQYDKDLGKARSALNNDDISYFYYHLPLKEHWRLYDYYRNETIFMDIEVSTIHDGYVTCLSIYNGFEIKTFVHGINFDSQKIIDALKQAKLIVTFNGNTFDIPFLKKCFNAMTLEIPCWDLRHTCKTVGLDGGLKDIERTLSIKRDNPIINDMIGGDPMDLWRTFHATGDGYFLDLLIEYNQEDTINLKTIADKIYPALVRKLFV